MTVMPLNLWLVTGGILSSIAALLHLVIIWGGPNYYRRFGAGDRFADKVARGDWVPVIITFGIAAVLFIWAAYAFAGAGLIPQLPLMRAALVAIAAVYLLRGLAVFPIMIFRPALATPFIMWSSVIVLVYGLVYAVGTWQAWPYLPPLG
jgi:hypothetical protein